MLVNQELQKLDSIFLAEYIAEKLGAMSHLKLQKLLFYVEAYHLAYLDNSIIEDAFEAWVHGPVSRKLYDTLKGYSILYKEIGYVQGHGELSPAEVISQKITKDQLVVIDDVLDAMGKYTATELENFTHSEKPWLDARRGLSEGDKSTKIISKETMKNFYKEELYGQAAED